MGGGNKKQSKKKSKRHDDEDNNTKNDDGNIVDERFQIAQSHPQFQKLHTKKKQQKITDDDSDDDIQDYGDKDGSKMKEGGEIDDRFKAILTDSRFELGGDIGLKEGGVDKYGRKKKKKKEKKKEKEEEERVDDEENRGEGGDVNAKEHKDDEDPEKDDSHADSDSANSEESDVEDEDKNEDFDKDPESRIAYLTALSRGEIDFSSTEDESSSDEDVDDNSSDDDSSTGSVDPIHGKAGILDPSGGDNKEEIEITMDKSRFLAVCNMDWTNVRAVDLLAVLSSFSPPGSVKFVHVYPSDFGLERMEKDKMFGPVGVWKKKKKSKINEDALVQEDSDESEDEVKDDIDSDNDDEDESSNQSQVGEVQNSDDQDGSENDEEEPEDFNLSEQYSHFKESGGNKFESDFDAEKLREYEAAKLKYYFAVVEFMTTDAADVAYKELDGMEMGHSSASLDLRSIPEADIQNVIKGRQFRDKASVLPSNYVPPDFVVAALQQTDVKCSWEEGDKERERMLTQYGVGNEAWNAMADGDDLRAYLASDASDSEDDGSSDDEETNQNNKGSNMRKLLGLDDDDDDNFLVQNGGQNQNDDNDDDSFFGGGDGMSSKDSGEEEEGTMSFTYTPGKQNLEEKIRTKINEKKAGDDKSTELTPWEKYQLKRKEKRKERKRQGKESKLVLQGKIAESSKKDTKKKTPSTKEELDLLLAGDNDEEEARDFHMRDLMRIEKNKSKKLRGSRKRKEDEITAQTSGLDFQIDTNDDRFAAVLEGRDERFGIDRTDPQFKETPAMRKILAEQTKRRKQKGRKRQKKDDVVADVSADTAGKSSGAMALSSLVKSLKSKVAKK